MKYRSIDAPTENQEKLAAEKDRSKKRIEHLAWCKKRALEYLDRGDVQNAIASMLSDMSKNDDTARAIQGPLGMIGLMCVSSGNAHEARRFIEGFN